MKLPQPQHATVPAIYRWHESRADDGLRQHLGASIIGRECERACWYAFRWCESQKFDGRMLRLFKTGKLAEPRFISELRAIGVTVWDLDDHGEQYRATAHGGHFGCSPDAVAQGFPEAPKATAVVEFKTHSAKSFASLVKKGVQASKPQHYTQMQVAMRLFELDRAAYLAVNKDTDELHFEWIHLDKDEADKYLKRAERVIFAAEPPQRIGDADYFVCKMCEFRDLCHGTTAPLPNCRTCAHATPEPDGSWSCAREELEVKASPKAGCSEHRYIPVLLDRFAEHVDADELQNLVVYRNRISGAEFTNGIGSSCVSSQEIRALADKSMLGQERIDPTIRELREEFGGMYAG